MNEFELANKFGYTSSFDQSNFSEENSENWQRILNNCQPHEIFETGWGTYDPENFGNTFLPNVDKYYGKGILYYDGLELMNGGFSSSKDQLLFTNSNEPVNIVAFSIPEGSVASEKKNSIVPSSQQLVVIIEMTESEEVSVSFKFGKNFKKYLESKQLNAGIMQEKKYPANASNIQEYFNSNMSHRTVANFALKTLDIDSSEAYSNTQQGTLEVLLKENGIQSFIYKNVCDNGNEIAIQGTLVNERLELNHIDASTVESLTNISLGQVKEVMLLQYEASAQENAWVVSELTIPFSYNEGACPDTNEPIDQEQINHVAGVVREHVRHTKREGAEKRFYELNNIIEKQLKNPFYKEVDLCVDLTIEESNTSSNQETIVQPLDGNQSVNLSGVFKVEPENENVITKTYKSSFNKGDKPCGITLDIKINANGEVSIDHKVSDDYLKEYESWWEKEIRDRGLEGEISIQDLREQVRKDLESAEVKNNFIERFIQDTKAFFNENIGGYIEAIQSTQKVVVHVFSEGKMTEGVWHSTGEDLEDHENFPSYMHLNSTVAGGIDGVIDEIASIPMAIKGIYGIATDEQQREALKKLFTKEGLSQMLDGLKQEYEKLKDDAEYREYVGGKTVVGVATMFFGVGFVTKGGKLGDVISTASTKAVKAVNAKVMKVIQELKDWFKKRPKDRKIIDDYKKEFGDDAINDMAVEAAEDIDIKEQIKHQPKKFVEGKKFEKNVEKLVDAGDQRFLTKIADEAGIPVEELADYVPLKQVQIRLPDGGFTVADNVWIKKIDDGFGGFDYDVIVNECKLSKATDFTARQKQFINKIGEPDVEFKLRSKKFIEEGFEQDIDLNIKSYIRTSGSGTADKLDDILVEKIK